MHLKGPGRTPKPNLERPGRRPKPLVLLEGLMDVFKYIKRQYSQYTNQNQNNKGNKEKKH